MNAEGGAFLIHGHYFLWTTSRLLFKAQALLATFIPRYLIKYEMGKYIRLLRSLCPDLC